MAYMRMNRQCYPAIGDRDWAIMERKNKSSEYRIARHEEEIAKIEEKISSLTLSKNSNLKEETGDLRIVLIGKTGAGKSATGNTIFGKEKFKVSGASQSETQVSRRVTGTVNGRRVTVVDTPGLADTGRDDKYIKKEISRCADLLPNGVHAFIYVMNMANPRYTKEDQRVFQHIKDMFGNGFQRYCILLFTHVSERPLDEYCMSEIQQRSPLGNFMELLDWRVAAIDNVAQSTYERKMHQDTLLKVVTKVGMKVSPPVYTNKAFENAQRLLEKYRVEALKENWDPPMMPLVEEIIGLNPNIGRADLEKQVQIKFTAQLQENMRIAAEKQRKLQMEYDRQEREHEQRRMEEMKRREEEFKAREEAMKRQLDRRLDEERRRAEEEARRQRKAYENALEELERSRRERQERERQERDDNRRRLQVEEMQYLRARVEAEEIVGRRRISFVTYSYSIRRFFED